MAAQSVTPVYEGAIDRGLEGVVACSTQISQIQDVTLTYRGYTIEDLAENSTFEEVVFLLFYGRLPNLEQWSSWIQELRSQADLSREEKSLLRQLPWQNVHPMTWLRSAVSLLAHFDQGFETQDPQVVLQKSVRLVGKMHALVNFFHNMRLGKDDLLPINPDQSLAWNFLHRLRGQEPSELESRIFDVCLILHADHELNCSSFTARVVASSLSDIYSSVVAAIGALKGPLHGGANEQVLKMLEKIGSLDRVDSFIERALAAKEKVMGIGHRVYKNGDPRAHILKRFSRELTQKTGFYHYHQMLERIENQMFQAKGLMPNVDFYSATVYYSLGIPSDLFTPIFACSRIAGWSAHIQEQWKNNRIYRPRGKYVGLTDQKWVPLEGRN